MVAELSVGTDIVEVARFLTLPFDRRADFYRRVFTEREIADCLSFRDPCPHFAMRFAAKEAVFKALCQWGVAPDLREIEVLLDGRRVPRVVLPAGAAGHLQVSLSVSRGGDLAIAVALVSRRPQP